MKKDLLLTLICCLIAGLSLSAQTGTLSLVQINESGIYSSGQKISVFACKRNPRGDSLRIMIYRNNKPLLPSKSYIMDKDSILVFETLPEGPCSVIIEAQWVGGKAATGLIVDPDKFLPGAAMPYDFRKYWKNQRKLLKDLPMEVKQVPVNDTSVSAGYICTDTQINCVGPKPARGYYAKPENAARRSLPVVLLVHAAGVKGNWCRSEPVNAMRYAKMNALCFDLNAHGMLNGQPESYYADLETGELKDYYLQGIENRDDFYFRGMYLRLMRTIEFLTSQPEWDGKRLIVIGESQGGGQALVSAGLDSRVSDVVAIVPAMCDWFGPLGGRMGGWPQPYERTEDKEKLMKSIPYFDAANIIKGAKANFFVEIGLIDETCPATSVYAALNQAAGKKILYAVPYRPHHEPAAPLYELWQENFYESRESFIKDFLKK